MDFVVEMVENIVRNVENAGYLLTHYQTTNFRLFADDNFKFE